MQAKIGEYRETLLKWWQILHDWMPNNGQLRRAMPKIMALDLVLLLSLVGLAAISRTVIVPKQPIATYQVPKEFTYNGVTYKAVDNLLTETDTLEHDQLEMLSPLRVINRDYAGSDGSQNPVVYDGGQRTPRFSRPAQLRAGQQRADHRS